MFGIPKMFPDQRPAGRAAEMPKTETPKTETMNKNSTNNTMMRRQGGRFFQSIALLLFAGVAALGLSNSFAQATVTLSVSGGQLVGAQNIAIGGEFYDVSFTSAGSCASLFGGCDDASDFDFQSQAAATAAAQALLDFVFIDGPDGNFDTQPNTILGCETIFCGALIPFALSSVGTGQIDFISAQNFASSSITDLATLLTTSATNDFTNTANTNFAIFTQTSNVPEPGALALLGVGLVGFVGARRRRFPG